MVGVPGIILRDPVPPMESVRYPIPGGISTEVPPELEEYGLKHDINREKAIKSEKFLLIRKANGERRTAL